MECSSSVLPRSFSPSLPLFSVLSFSRTSVLSHWGLFPLTQTNLDLVMDENSINVKRRSSVTAENISKVPFSHRSQGSVSCSRTPQQQSKIPTKVNSASSAVKASRPVLKPVTTTLSQTPSKVPVDVVTKFKNRRIKKNSKKAKRMLSRPEVALKMAEDCSAQASPQQVIEVLNYLLTENEVDEVTFRRLSSEKFSIDSLRRLSVGHLEADNLPSPSSPEQRVAEQEEVVAADTVAAAEAMPETTRPLGDMDVLAALRNYIKMMDDDEDGAEDEDCVDCDESRMDEDIKEYVVRAEAPTSVAKATCDVEAPGSVAFADERVVDVIESSPDVAPVPLSDTMESSLNQNLVTVIMQGFVERFGYIEFNIAVEITEGSESNMTILRRYSQFATMHAMLIRDCGSANLPGLPGRQIFPSLNGRWKNSDFLASRQSQLGEYLTSLLAISSSMSVEAKRHIQHFLCDSFNTVQAPAPAVHSTHIVL